MKVISLSADKAGFACAVATSIKTYYNNENETQFFDYLACSLNSINNILKTDNTDNIINNYEISVINDKTCINDKSCVKFKNYDNLISYHDLPNPYNISDYNNFIEKYKRRYFRLQEIIKNEDCLYFIRFGYENEVDINNFFHIIKYLNANIKVYFINVYYDKINSNCNYNYDIKNNNCFFIPINFYLFEEKNKIYNEDYYYKTLEFNWDYIFKIIINNK